MATGAQLGPFVLGEPIGRGGMATVWSATHTGTGLPVAIKVLAREGDGDHREQFRAEVRAMASLLHPRVVWILDYGEVDRDAVRGSGGQLPYRAPWLAMERAEGTLGDLRREAVPWTALRQVALAVLDALAHAHARGIVHLDLKPANVLTGGLRPGPRLSDFGLARIAEGAHSEGHVGHAGGTPGYMAPEQFLGAWRDYGPWTDLYAFGNLLWALAAGARPFHGRGWAALMEQHLQQAPPRLIPRRPVPVGFERWLKICLAKDPAHRFQSAAAAAAGLLALSAEVDDDGGWAMPSPDPLAPTTLLVERTTRSVTRERFTEPTPVPRGVAPVRPLSVPRRWARGAVEAPPPPLVGTGLALFGLREVPVVGRTPERDGLWRALRRVAMDGGVRAVVLRGASGTGKSRLARWLCERAHELGVADRLEARHGPISGPRDGVGPMVRRHLACDGLDRDETVARVASLLDDAPDDEVRSVAELCHPTSEAARQAGVRAVRFASPAERHAVVERALARLGRPAVVWLDDVQWGLDALELAERLLDRDRCTALLVLTARDELLAERAAEAGLLETLCARDDVTVLPVAPLDDGEVGALIDRLLPLDASLVSGLQQRAAGSPLYVVQVLGHWVRQGQLALRDGRFGLSTGDAPWLPDDLTTAWVQRVERHVGGDAGRAVELAAALGNTVARSEWRAVCAAAGTPADGVWLDALVRDRLLQLTDDTLSFAHGMLREAVEGRARRGGRWAEANRWCAEVLQRCPGPGQAARLGVHRLRAGQPELAVAPLLAAFDEHLDRDELRQAARTVEGAAHAARSARLPPSDARWGEVGVRRVHLQLIRLEQAEAEEGLRALWEGVRTHRWALDPRLHMLAGTLHKARGALTEAVDAYEAARSAFLAVGDEVASARACKQLAECHIMRGDATACREASRRGLALASGDEVTLASLQYILASLELRGNDLLAAETRARRAMEHARRAASRLIEAQALRVIAGIEEARGRFDEAEASYLRALDVVGEADEVFPVTASVGLAFLHLSQDRFDEAREAMETALDTVRGAWGVLEALCSLGLAVCAAADGDAARTEQTFSHAEGMLEASGYTDPIVPKLAARVRDLATAPDLVARAAALVEVQRLTLGLDDGEDSAPG